MKLSLSVLLILLSATSVQGPEGWEIFEKVTFEAKYFEEADAYFEVPIFNDELVALQGTTVTLSGYYIPLILDSAAIISSLPFSSCFFCGGAGPETVVEVQLKQLPKNLQPDTFLKVQGKLKLNDSDINHMNFILQEAETIKQ